VTGDGWTIDELASRVAAALGDGYPGAPNGRVRDVPDARAIRWYATIGLVDRPAAMRGRTALYGERHLLQLVAVKRRQAAGRSIAEIQAELAGASEATLREIAAAPESATAAAPTRQGSPDAVEAAKRGEPSAAHQAEPARQAEPRARFWAERPAPPPEPAAPRPALLTGVPLDGGAVLLLPAAPDHDDLAAIAAAARPLLDTLSARGLLRSER
jgi:DNA-binding transcriptional MerR regulator